MKKDWVAKLIGVVAVCVSAVAIYVSSTTGWMLAYNDATAHLNTARRIIDNLTPGLVQIGSVWLPLLHILELPFAANFTLWQTGLAGAIVSGISFVASCIVLYKLIVFITKDRIAGVIGVLVLLTNINLLYLQTTAMFEPLLMVTALVAVYNLSRWTKTGSVYSLILAAFFIMLATLTRYDGWALFIASGAYIFLVSLIQRKGRASGTLILYITLAGFGIFLWFLYNNMIFKDPFYFVSGEFSAKAQQDILYARGQLPTKHDLPLSFLTYSLAMIFNNGILIVGLFLMGFMAFVVQKLTKPSQWSPMLLVVPYAFNILTLYLGQSVIWLPMIKPYFNTYFNARYGILMLPACAFFIGFLAAKHYLLKGVIVCAMIIQLTLFLNPKILPIMGHNIGIITLQDTVSSVNDNTYKATRYLHSHYKGGLILVSSASADAFIFRAGIPLKNFITEGTGYYWRDSLKDPTKWATWIVFFGDKSDRVGRSVGKSPLLKKYFTKVYEDTTYQIWKKNE